VSVCVANHVTDVQRATVVREKCGHDMSKVNYNYYHKSEEAAGKIPPNAAVIFASLAICSCCARVLCYKANTRIGMLFSVMVHPTRSQSTLVSVHQIA